MRFLFFTYVTQCVPDPSALSKYTIPLSFRRNETGPSIDNVVAHKDASKISIEYTYDLQIVAIARW